MHVLYRLSTKSGLPGRRGEFSLYRNPLLHSQRLTSISGFVPFEWMAAMFLLRCSEVIGVEFKAQLN